MGKLKKIYSSSNWETSAFGGFDQVLWDLPDLISPQGFHMETDDRHYISSYNKAKLLSYFLIKVREYNLYNVLLEKAESKKPITSIYGTKYVAFVFNKTDVTFTLKSIIAKEQELRSLFINYSNLLANSKIYYKKYIFKGDSEEKIDKTQIISEIDKIKERISFYRTSFSSGDNFDDLKKRTKFVVPPTYDKEITYDQNCVKNADKLLKLLDISFERAETKITNLRTGKIDIPKIAEALSGNLLINYHKELLDKTKPFSVCILNDESGSMNNSRRMYQRQTTKMLYRTFSEILPQDKIYIYGHTGDYDPRIYVYQDKFNPTFEFSYNSQRDREFEENYDGPVISCIYDKIRQMTDEAILFIVISDGEPCGVNYGGRSDIDDLKRILEKCKRDNFVTCGIGFSFGGIKDIYKYYTIINDYSKAPEAVSSLVNNVVKSEFQ